MVFPVPGIDLRGLVALRSVAESGSIASATEGLGWSQPTVYHHLHKLETALDVRLLHKSARGSIPTRAGILLTQFATEILELCYEAERKVRETEHARASRLRIGAFPTAGAALLADSHQKLLDRGIQPEITLDEQSTLISSLNSRRLDIGLLYSVNGLGPAVNERVITTPLISERMYLAVPKGHPVTHHWQGASPDLSPLEEARWAFGIAETDPIDHAVRTLCSSVGYQPVVGARTDDYAAVLKLVASGMLVSVIPAWASGYASPAVHLLQFAPEVLRRETILAVQAPPGNAEKSTIHSDAVMIGVEVIREAARNHLHANGL